MTNLKTCAAVVGLAVLPLMGASALAEESAEKSGEAMESTIVGVAAADENFSTLVAAVKAAGLAETLSGDGPFTVFAPTNAAFGALPAGTVETLLLEENKDALKTVLKYHVVAGKVMAEDLVKLINDNAGTVEVTTVEGTTFKAMIDGEGVVLMDAAGKTIKIVSTDIGASNGVVHVIDSVLLPTGGSAPAE